MTLSTAGATQSGCSRPWPRRPVLGLLGVRTANFHRIVARDTNVGTGSIPEREASTGDLYNTSTVYSPQGSCASTFCLVNAVNRTIGELVALHRKVHLFDIDIPGKISFKVRRQSPLDFAV